MSTILINGNVKTGAKSLTRGICGTNFKGVILNFTLYIDIWGIFVKLPMWTVKHWLLWFWLTLIFSFDSNFVGFHFLVLLHSISHCNLCSRRITNIWEPHRDWIGLLKLKEPHSIAYLVHRVAWKSPSILHHVRLTFSVYQVSTIRLYIRFIAKGNITRWGRVAHISVSEGHHQSWLVAY